MGFALGLFIGLLIGFGIIAWLRRGRNDASRAIASPIERVAAQPAVDRVIDRSPTDSGLDPALENLLRHASTPPNDNRDPEQLLTDGLRAFTETGGVSTLVLQRRLQLDFAQATILIEEMERRGYVSAKHEQRQRKLLPLAYKFVRSDSSD
jgi:DNA segregation ATPase FtsK/SpoIIIE-like protein